MVNSRVKLLLVAAALLSVVLRLLLVLRLDAPQHAAELHGAPQTRTPPAAAAAAPPSVLLVTASTAPCISPQSDWLQTKLLQTKLDAAERRGWGFWSASDRDGDGADAASSAGRCADAARLLPLLAPVPALERYGWLLYVDPELAVTGGDALELPWARLAEPTTDVLLWGEERSGGVVVDPGVMLVRRGDASAELFGAVLDACAASADATTRDAFQQLLRGDAGGWRRRVALAPELRLVADWRQVVPRLRSGERALGEALWGSTTPPFATSFRGCAALCAVDGDDEPPARGAACRAALLRCFTFGAAPRLGAVGVEHVRLGSLHARPAANTTAWMAHRDRLAGCLPALHIVGAQRAGLGSLHWTLRRGWHKGLATNAGDRELHFFSMDNRYRQGLLWYQQRFYPTSDALRRCDAAADAARAVEVSSSYFDYPRSALRLFAVAPHARVAVVLREPVERAVSAFNLRWLTWLCGKLIWQLPRCWEGVTSEAAVKENQVGPFQVHAALKVWRACAPGDGKAPEKVPRGRLPEQAAQQVDHRAARPPPLPAGGKPLVWRRRRRRGAARRLGGLPRADGRDDGTEASAQGDGRLVVRLPLDVRHPPPPVGPPLWGRAAPRARRVSAPLRRPHRPCGRDGPPRRPRRRRARGGARPR